MGNTLQARMTFIALLLFGGFVFFALQPKAVASETGATRYLCAARVDCGGTTLPSTQDLPLDRTPSVVSRNADEARSKCMSKHTGAYARLAKSADGLTPENALNASRGCKIVSEALPQVE
jgi:hypothetical protein